MVNSNGKFHSFLVRILIRNDNTDNKVFKKAFYTKNQNSNIYKVMIITIIPNYLCIEKKIFYCNLKK